MSKVKVKTLVGDNSQGRRKRLLKGMSNDMPESCLNYCYCSHSDLFVLCYTECCCHSN